MTDPVLVPCSGVCPGYESPMAAFAHQLVLPDGPYSSIVRSVTVFIGTERHAFVQLKQPVQLWNIDAVNPTVSLNCVAFILTYSDEHGLADAWMCDDIHFAANLWKTLCEQKGLRA